MVTEILAARSIREEKDLVAPLMFLSGLRVSDVCHLTVEDVGLEGRSLYVRAGKGNKDRRLPITPKLTRILHGWITTTRRRCAGADSPWLFLHMKRQHRYHGHLLNPKAISHQVRNQIVPILLTCRGSLVQVQYRPPFQNAGLRRPAFSLSGPGAQIVPIAHRPEPGRRPEPAGRSRRARGPSSRPGGGPARGGGSAPLSAGRDGRAAP